MDEIIPLPTNIACPKCGGSKMQYDPSLGDNSPVTCNTCGESLGKLSEAKTSATNNALNQLFIDEVKKTLGDAFQGEAGIKFEPK